MRALVYHGPGNKAWEEVPDPEITDDGDVVVRVDATTICGTDLHILKGDVPAVHSGRVLGHEAVGTVEEVGDGVRRLCPGDRVLVSCISACGTCRFCREGRYGQCLDGGGWILGHKIDGTQAEYVRVLHLEEQWSKDITITMGLVDASSTPILMRLITTGQIDARRFITHRFGLEEFDEAYDVFARAADTSALKVVLSRGSEQR